MAEDSRTLVQKSGLWLALGALLIIVLLPQPEGLPVAGQRMLACWCFRSSSG